MKDEDFNELVASIQEAIAIDKGEMQASRRFEFSPTNVTAIRKETHKNQKDFARMIGVSVGTLRNWEQGRRHPVGPALALLKVVSANPNYVAQVLL